MLFALLTSSSSSAATSGGCFSKENLPSTILWIVVLAAIFIFMVFRTRSQAKKQKEQMDQLNAIQPGNKVKTIGGICGIVVEVCPEDNTFVLETGTEASGKSYLKFDKQAIYQTDAVPQPAVQDVAETVTESTEEIAEPTETTESTEEIAEPTEVTEETAEPTETTESTETAEEPKEE